MKKEGLAILLVFFLIGFISASYQCSTSFSEDKKEIDILTSNTINGLGIGIINTYSSEGVGVYYVNLMIDGERFVLTDEENSSSFDIQKGEGTIILLNSTEESAKVEIDGDSEEILEDEIEAVKGYQIYITDLQGTFPGNAEVGGFIGQEKITLDQDTKTKKVTVAEEEYVVELFSATNENAIITIKTCNGTISEVEDVETGNNTVENNSTENQTISENATEENNEPVENLNETTIGTEVTNEEGKQEVGENEESNLTLIIIAIIIALLVIGFVIFLFVKLKRDDSEGVSQQTPPQNPPPQTPGSGNAQNSTNNQNMNRQYNSNQMQ